MDFSKLLEILSQGQKNTVIATLIQWPVMASMLFLSSTDYQSFEHWTQLVLSLAASILATFMSYTLTTLVYAVHNVDIKRFPISDYLLYLPTLISSVFLAVIYFKEITLSLFRSVFIFSLLLISLMFLLLGFKLGGKKDSQDKSNSANRRRKCKHMRCTCNHLILSYPIVIFICILLSALLWCVFTLLP